MEKHPPKPKASTKAWTKPELARIGRIGDVAGGSSARVQGNFT